MFTAKDAFDLSNSNSKGEIRFIEDLIRECASVGFYHLDLYLPLDGRQIDELKKRGFEVLDHGSLTIQKDNLYHTIKWNLNE